MIYKPPPLIYISNLGKTSAMMGKILVFLLLGLCFQDSQSADSCGRSLEKHLQTRIVDGVDIGYYKYPWYGVLKINNVLKCGCTLIDDQFALTEANCFANSLPVNATQIVTDVFTVTFGMYNRCDKNETTRKTFPIKLIYINGNFVKGKPGDNIAILQLGESADFEPVCLPPKPIPVDNRPSEGIIVGFGMTRYSPIVRTCTAHEGRVLIYNNDDCSEALSNVGEDPAVLNKSFCAGGVKDTKPYGCGIDLGGPLTSTDDNGTWYILGIISFKNCRDNDNITLYVDVSQYLDWIQSIINPATPTSPTTETPTTTTTTTTKKPDEEYPDIEYDDDSTSSSASPPASTTAQASPFVIGSNSRHSGHKHQDHKKNHHEKHHNKNHHEKHHNKNHHEKHHKKH